MSTKNPAIDRAIGARVRFARIEKRLSQGALGEALGISFQQCQKYELGKDRISASMLLIIARTVEKDVAFFFEGVGTEAEVGTPLADIMDRRGRTRGETGQDIAIIRLLQEVGPDVKKRVAGLLQAIVDQEQPAAEQHDAPALLQQAAE